MVLRCELFNTIALKLPDSIISQFLMHVESLFTGSKDYYKVNHSSFLERYIIFSYIYIRSKNQNRKNPQRSTVVTDIPDFCFQFLQKPHT